MKHNRGLWPCALVLMGCLLVGGLAGCTALTRQAAAAGTASGSTQSSDQSAAAGSALDLPSSVSLPGTWSLVLIESDGLQMTGAAFEDASGCTVVITLEEDGTGALTYAYADADAETGALTWAQEDDTLTLTPDDGSETLSTQIGDNCFSLTDEDITMLFAKEGTDAADPALYLDDSAAAFVGTWESQSVRIDGGEEQTSIDGAVVSGLIRLTLRDDLSAEVFSDWEEEPVSKSCWWALKDGKAILTDDELDYSIASGEADTLVITCEEDDITYEFVCARAEE